MKIKEGVRPDFSERYMDSTNPPYGNRHYTLLVRLIEASWKQDPRDRPSFAEVKKKLRVFWLGPPNYLNAE